MHVVLAAIALAALTGTASAGVVTFDWATVGNPGNAPDPLTSGDWPGIGSVDYTYRIAKHEVTNAQYTAFLNAVDPHGVNPNDVYLDSMTNDARGGINFDEFAPTGGKYATKPNMANKPVIHVSYFDAMRFVNWLHNGQGAGNTETGAYTISGGTTDVRNADARFFIPTENEWYKAAYHQPAAQGGDADGYWLYPTATNTTPTVATATVNGDIANPGSNVVNYFKGADWNGQNGNVTSVGSAGPFSASFYGTFDQAGNVGEWTETVTLESFGQGRVSRGGTWFIEHPDSLRSSNQGENIVWDETSDLGFRIASLVPEPSCLMILALGTLVLARRTK